MRALILVAAATAGVLLFLLTTATANTTLFARHFPLLLGLTGAVTILLAGLVAFQLHRLWRDYKARVFGSRLKYRLLLMFALMAVVPGVLIYAVSVQFAVKSIESWFDVRVDGALEGGLNLGRSALDYLQGELTAKAESMALDLAGGKSVAVQINRLREQAGVDTAARSSPAARPRSARCCRSGPGQACCARSGRAGPKPRWKAKPPPACWYARWCRWAAPRSPPRCACCSSPTRCRRRSPGAPRPCRPCIATTRSCRFRGSA